MSLSINDHPRWEVFSEINKRTGLNIGMYVGFFHIYYKIDSDCIGGRFIRN
jgi:hypothetical protein